MQKAGISINVNFIRESFNSRKSINVSKSEEKDVSLEKKKSVNVYKSNKDFEQGTKGIKFTLTKQQNN